MTSISAQKMTVEHPVVHTMNDSTILIGVVKGGQLGLKGKSTPNMKLPLFYKKGKQPHQEPPFLVPVSL
jgi:hypothetical protein